MERIVIEVDDATAKKWRSSSKKLRDEILQQINLRMAKKLMAASADSREEFKQFLKEAGETMKERGLTEDILQDILKEDE